MHHATDLLEGGRRLSISFGVILIGLTAFDLRGVNWGKRVTAISLDMTEQTSAKRAFA